MSSADVSPVSPTHSDESPKNTIRVIKTSNSDNTLVEVKVAGETGAKVTVFGGDGPVPEKKDEPPKGEVDKENDDGSVHLEPLTKEQIDEIVSKYNQTKNLEKFLDFFWSVDEFGFGIFTIHQLIYRLRRMGRMLTVREIARMFVDLDHDQDRLVSLDEFLYEMTREKPKERTDEEWRALFEKCDKNKDGFVCSEDIAAVFKDKGETYPDVDVYLFLRNYRPDDDLRLDFISFKKAFRRPIY